MNKTILIQDHLRPALPTVLDNQTPAHAYETDRKPATLMAETKQAA